MKITHVLPVLALTALMGCAQQLGKEDKALLVETHNTAMEARNQAAQAAAAATAAQASAAQSAELARQAGEKSDRIFKHSQNK